jgi:hypothetical protein
LYSEYTDVRFIYTCIQVKLTKISYTRILFEVWFYTLI